MSQMTGSTDPGDVAAVAALVAALPMAGASLMVETDASGRATDATVVSVNEWFVRLVSQPQEYLIGLPVSRVWPDLDPIWMGEVAAVVRTGEPRVFEHATEDGLLRCTAFRPAHSADLVCITIEDATDSRLLRDALRMVGSLDSGPEPGTFFRLLAEYLGKSLSLDAVCIDRLSDDGLTAHSVALWVDGELQPDTTYPLAGTPCAEASARGFACFPTGIRERFPTDALLREMGAESYAGVGLRGYDGRPVGIIACLLRTPLARLALIESVLRIAAVRAVAELDHLASTAAIRSSEEHYRLLADNVLDVIWTLRTDGRFGYVSPSVEKLRGYTPEEVMAQSIEEALTPDSLAVAQAAMAGALETMQAGESPRVFRGELEQPCKDGSTVWTEAAVAGLFAPDGEFAGFVGISRDITERRRAETERRAMERELMEAHRSESVGRLAGGVAHDINNQLAAVMCLTELVMEDVPSEHASQEMLQQVMSECKRAAGTVRQLLAYASKAMIMPRRMDLNEAINRLIPALTRTLGDGMELVWRPEANLGLVKLDGSQVEYVLTQLCSNARDACRGTGRITLRTANTILAAPETRGGTRLSAGGYAVVTVQDSGPGMTPDQIAVAFEPFATSKRLGEGQGLGLPAVRGIAHQNGGAVEISNVSGGGLRVSVAFPRHDEPVQDFGGL
ncbi:MAG: PAS domain S-box protein [Armatimonadetes bacterium]|nr:PAS domain S-box protein [Armatimonadota bacterium]